MPRKQPHHVGSSTQHRARAPADRHCLVGGGLVQPQNAIGRHTQHQLREQQALRQHAQLENARQDLAIDIELLCQHSQRINPYKPRHINDTPTRSRAHPESLRDAEQRDPRLVRKKMDKHRAQLAQIQMIIGRVPDAPAQPCALGEADLVVATTVAHHLRDGDIARFRLPFWILDFGFWILDFGFFAVQYE